MWRRKSIKSLPYALTEWLDRSASQIQGTRAPAVMLASLPVPARAWARKASTLAAAGESPSRNSVRSGTSGVRTGSLSSFAGTAGRLLEGMKSIFPVLPGETKEHKADYGTYYATAVASRDLAQTRC